MQAQGITKQPNCCCAFCEQSMYLPPYRLQASKTVCCSKACADAYKVGRPLLERRRQVELVCRQCGESFTKPQSQAATAKYCSRACSALACREAPRRAGVHEVVCSNCGETVKKSSSAARMGQTHYFCNSRCKGEWQRTHLRGSGNPAYKGVSATKLCDYCGTPSDQVATQMRRNKHHFCSHTCYGLWRVGKFAGSDNVLWRGGVGPKYYGPNWQAQRKKARQRDLYFCQSCGVTETALDKELDVHHKKPFRTFGYIPEENQAYREANRLHNLVSLCASCHRTAELATMAFL